MPLTGHSQSLRSFRYCGVYAKASSTAGVLVPPWFYSKGAEVGGSVQQHSRLQCHSPVRVTNKTHVPCGLNSRWQIFRIGTVDVLKACDACADMGQLYRSVPIR